jgi:acetate kinase
LVLLDLPEAEHCAWHVSCVALKQCPGWPVSGPADGANRSLERTSLRAYGRDNGKTDMNILVFNCGSSSLGFKVYETDSSGEPEAVLTGKAHRVGVKGSEPAFVEFRLRNAEPMKVVGPIDSHGIASEVVCDYLKGRRLRIDAVGHRFVHGGRHFSESVVVDELILRDLRTCSSLAPIHNPVSLSVLDKARAVFPGATHFATFDTAFHASIPPRAFTYALPRDVVARYGFRKFGFHGLSYQYVSQEVRRCLGETPAGLKMIVCHLGTGGSSVCAIRDGRSLDTSMGYSPLPGLVMSTRAGDVDPMLASYLMAVLGMREDEVENLLNKKSGLLGVSETSSDLRDIVSRMVQGGDSRAALAFDMYVHRVKKYIGSYVAALGGVDVLAFTDDIGVQVKEVRAAICRDMAWCGISLDRDRNCRADPLHTSHLEADGARVRVLTVPTDEELVICQEGIRLLERTHAAA